MAKLPGNKQLLSKDGRHIGSLAAVNRLPEFEKRAIYSSLLPSRLLELLAIDRLTLTGPDNASLVNIVAHEGFGFVRIEVKARPEDADLVFFAELADTQYHQMELAFCIICDPEGERYYVDVDEKGRINYFASHGRNIREEERSMAAGLFPNQTRRGLRLFAEFFPLVEWFADALGVDMIVAETLSYDNAIRYEHYGFDYLTGKKMMLEIDRGFAPGGLLLRRLDGSTPFRMPGAELTLHGRSWAIHDGIMDEPWDGVMIYKMIGMNAGVSTFRPSGVGVSL